MQKIGVLLIVVVILLLTGFLFWHIVGQKSDTKNYYNTNHQALSPIKTTAHNTFALNLFESLKKEHANENIFFSPYSIYTVLAMMYEGAGGETERQMQSVLRFKNQESLHRTLQQTIHTKNATYTLQMANAIWVQKDYPFSTNYIDTVERFYDAYVAHVDFTEEIEREKVRRMINDFIAQKTENKITELLHENDLNPLIRMVLTNAVYFKGDWDVAFDASQTTQESFTMHNGKKVKVDMMRMVQPKKEFPYTETKNVQVLELPYKDNRLSMIIFLPKKGKEYEVTAQNINTYLSNLTNTKIHLIAMPKFEYDNRYQLKKYLESLGMSSAFNDNADFSKINKQKALKIDEVIHQSYVKVDEKGTEAAAATAALMAPIAAAPVTQKDTVDFVADHPFTFIIRENASKNIMFIGEVNVIENT